MVSGVMLGVQGFDVRVLEIWCSEFRALIDRRTTRRSGLLRRALTNSEEEAG